MDLICYTISGPPPEIRPAEATREWMDRTAQSYAYRCLPLNIANAHGWEILSPIAFDAVWNGGSERQDIILDVPPGVAKVDAPISFFGEAVLTFHINALFRTPPGWNLWVGGSPNRPKDGIYPLTGVIETDWSPYTFTMNWRFTRRNHRVHFDAGEPICFIFPVRRALLGAVRPRFLPIQTEPQLAVHHAAWAESRDVFNKKLEGTRERLPPTEQWQRRYFQGLDMTDQPVVPDHLSMLRTAPFKPFTPGEPAGPDTNVPISLNTDAVALGKVIGRLACAIKEGAASSEPGRTALAARLTALGLGASEALEVVWAAMDEAGEAGG